MEHLTDINEICKALGTTSRTLRFYEDKGIIESTKDKFSNRRKYNEKQIQQIKNVLVLRTLGLSIKSIKELQHNDYDLKTAIISKKAEIYASIDTKIKEINLLNEAVGIIEAGKDIFDNPLGNLPNRASHQYLHIAKSCTESILKQDYTTLNNHFSKTMRNYLPESAFWSMWHDTIKPCGKFVSLEKCVADEKSPYIIYQYIRYEKFGVKIKFVFYGEEINGLWASYYEI